MKKDETTIEVELDERDMDWLENEARKMGLTFEGLINRIIRDALQKIKKEPTKLTKTKRR